MKLALFFFLSFAVHATAFLLPVSLNGRGTDRAITVTILPIESASELSGGQAAAAKPIAAKRPRIATTINQAGEAAPNAAVPALEKIPVDSPSLVNDKIVVPLAGESMIGTANRRGEGAATGTEAGGNNFPGGKFSTGSGNGTGNDEGSGAGQIGPTLTQARYRETPQPHYPDSARREGKEGRVLLRVLVDEEGRTKVVEVNSSSGHAKLDQAATEALKKWRFVPARAGGKPVETWVKVPIDFQLSNAKP